MLKTLPQSTHAILFVGTKILAAYSKPEWMDLHPQDVTLLLLCSRAEFHPIERTVMQDEVCALFLTR